MNVCWLLYVFAFVPAGTVGKHQDFLFRIRRTESVQQFIDGLGVAHRSNEAVAFPFKRAHGAEGIGMFSDDLFFDHRCFSFGHPAATDVIDATKAGFVFKEYL